MDNDKKFVKKIKKVYRDLNFVISYKNKSILKEEQGNQLIVKKIEANLPCMIARLGSVETKCLYPWIKGTIPSEKVLINGMYQAGIFPPTREDNALFSKIYSNAISEVDIMALCSVYKEREIVNTFCKNSTFVKARSLEPYYFEKPWSKTLTGKKVLIIHPFIESIKKQYLIREKIFINKATLPKFKSLSLLSAVQSNAGATSDFDTWHSAYEFMCEEICKLDFEVALIGAGAYGLPLAAHVKTIGKIGIQMSGATQILFGIKGKRWDDHPIISKLYNENWIRPSLEETPPQIDKVEGGSYW